MLSRRPGREVKGGGGGRGPLPTMVQTETRGVQTRKRWMHDNKCLPRPPSAISPIPHFLSPKRLPTYQSQSLFIFLPYNICLFRLVAVPFIFLPVPFSFFFVTGGIRPKGSCDHRLSEPATVSNAQPLRGGVGADDQEAGQGGSALHPGG